MKTRKKKTIVVIVFVAVLALVALFGIFLGLRKNQMNRPSDSQTLKEMPKATVSDEETLRELLLEESERTIEVKNDMEVDEQFIVKGKKTLTGKGELRMALHAEWGQSLLLVSEGASLTMDGLVLNGNYVSDGIHMEKAGTLTYLSGTIKRTDSYGIQALGDVTIKDVNIEQADYIALFAQKGSKVTMTGGRLTQTATNDIYVQKGATMDINGKPVFEGCMGDCVANYGTLDVHGGTYKDVNSYVFNNYGELKVVSNEKKGEQVECTGARLGVFVTRKGSKTNISGVYVHDTKRQGVVTVGGKTEIKNSKFERTGYHAIEIQTGKATVENVTVIDSKNAGLEGYTDANVTIKNFTVDGCDGIGIASRGAKITGEDIKITGAKKYGISCGNSKNGKASATITNAVVTNTEKSGFYVYNEAVMKLENIQVSGSKSRGIYIADNANLRLLGNSIVRGNEYRGIEARGKFVMDDGKVYDNKVKNSGAGVYVSEKGNFTMNGGSIYNNTSGLRGGGVCVTDGTVTINKGDIYNNTSTNNGGGLYAQKKAVVTLKNGSIRNNKSELYGNGIHIASAATKVTMSDQFYLGGNDVKIDNVEATLQITGSRLAKHSASDPLLLTPNYNAKEGTVVASCKNAGIAKSLAVMVRSGDGSYDVVQNSKNFEIAYADADMDMTGADTVYVSNFQELKAAVKSTTSKRYIVLRADIAMEERLRFPGGATICIKDDGNRRTLTRANGFADNMFVTHYGTGFYLEATKPGNLIVDGTHSVGVDGVKVQPLVRTAGSTVLRNVVLQNNGALVKDSQVRGALMRQLYGDFKIYNSVLSCGICSSGGAVMIDKGQGYIEGSTFSDNQSVIGAGAVRAAANTELEIVDSTFTRNHAGTTGGAVVAVGGAHATITDTKFVNNTAANFGGALSAQDEGTTLVLKGINKETAIFENNSSKTIGAVCVQTKAQLSVFGYTFENNMATSGRAGAIAVNSGALAMLENTGFYKNQASGSGGAVSVENSTIRVSSCEFGKENAGNIAGDKGGAILATGKSSVNMDLAKDGLYNRLGYNQAVVGGAICVYNGGDATIDGYTLEGNQARDGGGAIYIDKNCKATSINANFVGNTTKSNGGAVHCKGAYQDTNSSYKDNSGRNGGAVIAINGGKVTLAGTDAKFNGNQATANGTALFVQNDGSVASVTGCTFEGDATQTVQVNGSLTFDNITGATLVKGTKGILYVAGYEKGNQVTITPNAYIAGNILLTKPEEVADDVFKAACVGITVTPDANGKQWFIDENGQLQKQELPGDYVARIGDKTYETLADALQDANAADGEVIIYLSQNANISKQVTIQKNITITNEPGMDITITRSANITMFYVSSGAQLTLGTNDDREQGKLIVDGTTTAAQTTRIIDNRANATFILGKNATLQNANNNQWGSTLINRGNAELYGDVKNNTCTGAGGAVLQYSGKLTVYGGNYIGNKATRKASGSTTASYGGAIRVEAGTVEIKGGTFSDNHTVGQGGALWIGPNAVAIISGGTFMNNTAGEGSDIYSNVTVEITGLISDVNRITITPSVYEIDKVVLTKGDTITNEEFRVACTNIIVIPDSDGNAWTIDSNGKLQKSYAARIGAKTYRTFTEALNAANNDGGIGAAEDIVIYVNSNVDISSQVTINKNIAITNESGKYVTLARSVDKTMFYVSANAKLTLGTNDDQEKGQLIVDGGGAAAQKSRIVDNRDNATFILGKNATLQNANNNQWGSALINRGNATAELYGSVKDNICTGDGGAILQHGAAGKMIVYGGTYTGNQAANQAKNAYGAVIRTAGGRVEIRDGIFSDNHAAKSGSVLYVASGTTAVISGGMFKDNTAGNGGDVYCEGTLEIAGPVTDANGITVTLKADAYAEGNVVLTKTDAVTDEQFKAACVGIQVTPDADGKTWSVDETGKLKAYAARIGATYYDTLEDAVNAANTSGGTKNAEDVVIYVRGQVVLTGATTIKKNIAIRNEADANAIVKRNGNIVMFTGTKDAKLTLGTNDENEKGKFIVDGATGNAVGSRMIQNPAGASFVLGKNATLQNANVNNWGTALNNAGTADLYGSVINNTSTAAGGAILQSNANAKLTIHEGNYTGNKATRPASNKNGVSQGSAIIANGGTVTVEGGTFSENSTTGAGGVIYVYKNTTVIILGGTFKGNMAGTDGNALYIASDGKAVITGGEFATEEPAQEIYVAGTLEYCKLSEVLIKKSENGTVTETK